MRVCISPKGPKGGSHRRCFSLRAEGGCNSDSMSRIKGHVTPLDKLIGTQLKKARVSAGLSQDKLARAVGISFQQVQKYEKGINRISASRLLKFSLLLNRPIEFFFDGARKNKPAKGSGSDMQIYRAGKAIFDVQDPILRAHLLAIAKRHKTLLETPKEDRE